MYHIDNKQKEKALSMIMNLDEKFDGVDLLVSFFIIIIYFLFF